MDKQLINDLDILKNSLRHIFSAFAERIVGISLSFLPGNDLDSTNPPSARDCLARIDVNGGANMLRIERDGDAGFRLSITSYHGETLENCGHVLIVPKGKEGEPDKWLIDTEAAKNSTSSMQFVERVFGLAKYDTVRTRVEGTYGFIYHAIEPLVRDSLMSGISHEIFTWNNGTADEPNGAQKFGQPKRLELQ